MPQACRRRRALRAALGLAVVLALGFAADALVLVTTRARADAAAPAAVEKGRQSALAGTSEDRAILPMSGESEIREDGPRSSRTAIFHRLAKGARPGGSDSWSLVMIGDHPGAGCLRRNHRRRPPVPAPGGGSGDASRRSREPFAQAHGLPASGRPARLARRGRAAGITVADQRAG